MNNAKPCSSHLHLGCGQVHIPDYVNIDIQTSNVVDLVANIKDLPFSPASIDTIYSCSVLEHFGRNQWQDVLKHWVGLLKPGGVLYISVPDFDAIVGQYQASKNINSLLGLVMGGQNDHWDWHGMIFNYEILEKEMKELGMQNVGLYRWQDYVTGRQNIDDYSQAYLPHMDKENGRLMVLNIKAHKPEPALGQL